MIATVALFAVVTSDRWFTFVALFFGQALSWMGVPALGAATAGAAGALASQGEIHLWAVLVVGSAGSELGSLGGWWLGNRIARAGLEEDGRFATRRRKAVAAGEKVATRWGRLMVFFVPSWVSGALGTPFRQFAAWNLLAVALWMTGASLAAYGIGSAASGGSVAKTAIPLVVGALALAAIAAILWWFWRGARARRAVPSD